MAIQTRISADKILELEGIEGHVTGADWGTVLPGLTLPLREVFPEMVGGQR